jgi:hypothetical protein
VQYRRRGGWRPPPDEDNAIWRLLWVIVGATAFTVVVFVLDLI